MTSVRIIPVSQEEPIEFIEPLKLTTSSSQITSKSEASVREEFRETVTTTTKSSPSESNMKTSLMIGKFAGPQDSNKSTTALETWKENGNKSLIAKLREDFFNIKEGIDTDMGVIKRDDAFEVNIDVTGFQPKDLTVIIKDDLVTITGCHEEKSLDGTRQIQRKFERKYTLPPNVDNKKIKSVLSLDGRSLKFEAPYIPKEAPVAITYEKKVTMKTVTTRQG